MAEFLTIEMWVHAMIEKYSGNEHLIFDGTPRKLHEAQVFDSLFSFYKLNKPWVINIEVSKEECSKRLMARHRMDDKNDEIEKRLSWFETEVVPVINHYKDHSKYNYLTIDGERSVEDIFEDIVKRVGLR
jgi:adenylate kinase family enzyme